MNTRAYFVLRLISLAERPSRIAYSDMRTLSIIVFWLTASSLSAADPTNPFGRTILPILSDKCFACHGPDAKERKADLRLDTREGVLQAVDLANVSASELLRRITTKDPDEVMPPPSSHKEALTPDQVTTLTEWVRGGVVWENTGRLKSQ